ncbi:MAG: hypothetical protein ABIZ04_14890 [Opitutus sp.]
MNIESYSLQLFSPEPDALFPLDVAARLARMSRHRVLVCCRRGMISPHRDPGYGGIYFDADAIRMLQRIEYLHTACGVNLLGVEIILKLMADVDESRARARD